MASTYHKLIYTVFTLLLASTLASCLDDESFTTDRNSKLVFSSDTISFDTLFSEVPSSTERFLVYNNNKNGLRIANAKLESNGASGFKMNVDGKYGVSVNDIEILGNDSIFVFVEVKAPKQDEDTPTLVSDAIIFTLESGESQKVILEAYGQNIKVINGTTINNDTTISSDIPCVIYDNIVVGEDATLTIAAGTRLFFHKNTGISVYGRLNIEGTLEEPVTIRGDRTDKMLWNLPYDRLDSQWEGIHLQPSCKGCSISHADIHSGVVGVSCDSINGELNIDNSTIHNCKEDCLFIRDSKALVSNSQISNSGANCVTIYGGAADFYHCTIAQFYPFNADRGHALYISNFYGDFRDIVESANFYNCFITGIANDEIYGNPGDEELNLKFYSSVLLTDVSDDKYFIDCIADSKEEKCFKDTNFKMIDADSRSSNYCNYDFHLDSLSTAAGKGSTIFSASYPLDKDGNPRGAAPDAGCYQQK